MKRVLPPARLRAPVLRPVPSTAVEVGVYRWQHCVTISLGQKKGSLVIDFATVADLNRMDACCDNAENAETLEAFEHWDAELHQAIADAAHNSFVANVFGLMKTVRAQGDWGQLKKKSVTPERRLAYQAEHRAIVDALRDRDAVRARELTLAHLLHVRQNLLGY